MAGREGEEGEGGLRDLGEGDHVGDRAHDEDLVRVRVTVRVRVRVRVGVSVRVGVRVRVRVRVSELRRSCRFIVGTANFHECSITRRSLTVCVSTWLG